MKENKMNAKFIFALCIIAVCIHFGYGSTVANDFDTLLTMEDKLTKKFDERFKQLETKFQAKTDDLEKKLEETANKLEETKTRLAEIEEKLGAVAASKKSDAHSNMTKRIVPHSSGNIAFSAHLSTGAKELGLHHIVPFDTVYANEGNAFDPLLHVFTCPESGVYIFMTAVLAEHHQNTVTEIAKNGKPLVQAYSAGSTGSHGYDQGFNAVITDCAAGDRVWVQIHDHQGTTVFAYGYSTFSGYRLF